MTNKDIDKLTEKEAKDKLKSFYSKSTVASTYLTIKEKIDSMSKQFSEGKIDVMSTKDDPSFDRFIKFSKESANIEKAQVERLTLLDEDILMEERRRRMEASESSLEGFVRKRKKEKGRD